VAPFRSLLVILLVLSSSSTAAWAQQRELTGRVTSSGGEALPGAIVQLVGARAAALTDATGAFRLGVPAAEVTLSIQILGYKNRQVRVPVNETTVNVVLEIDALGLEELVVTGRSTELARRNVANAISVVSAGEMMRAPSESMEKVMAGKVTGAIVEQNSGAPGGGIQVKLRGVSTINATAEPLYVIDGVIASNVAIPSNANAITKAAGGSNPSLNQDALVNRIVDINPADIESLQVLKGASAAAIYGSKAANGVIIITTKRGLPGAARFNLTQRLGYFDASHRLGFREWTRDDAVAAFGASASRFFDASGSRLSATDNEEELTNRNALSGESILSVSGGSENTRVFLSGLWKNDEGVINNTGFAKHSLRLNLDQRVGSRLNVSLNSNLLHTVASRGLTNNDNSGTSYWMVFPFTPNFVDLRRCTATTTNPLCTAEDKAAAAFPDNPYERSNPLETAALMQNDEDVWRFVAGGSATFQALGSTRHDLRFVLHGGLDYFAQENELLFPPALQFEPVDDGLAGTSLLTKSDNRNTNLNGTVIYSFTPAGGAFRATSSGGISYEDEDLNSARIVSRNLVAGKPNIDAGTTFELREIRRRVTDVALHAQEEVLLADERLLLSGGISGYKSSANGDHEKFFVYPKLAASFRIPTLTANVDELKLRAAWGQTGNRPLFGQKFTPLRGNRNIEGLAATVPVGTLGDANIEPERQSEIEAGIDAVLSGERVSFEFTGFQKNISNLLLERELAPSSGFVLQVFNGGEMRVRGIEAAVQANAYRSTNLNWISRLTFYADRSEVLSLPVPSFRTGGFGTALGAFQIQEGRSATEIVANIVKDCPTVSEQAPAAGMCRDTVAAVGNASPDFKIAWSNDVTFGRFQLYGHLDWQKGAEIINLTTLLYDFGQNTKDFAEDPQTVRYFLGEECTDDAGAPCVLTKGQRRINGFGRETRPYIEGASYLKLRELALSYDVPRSLLSGLFGSAVQTMRLNLSGRNLLTITGYSGLDPEVSNFGNQAIARNIDVAPFPPSRSFWLSIDVGF
jgi:TonB-linked SusC/RagA family outer membrane protein